LAANLSKKRARAIAATTVEAYRTHLRGLAKLSPLEIWHSRVEFAREINRIEHRGLRSELQGILVKARDNLVQDDNFPHVVKGQQVRIEDRPPHLSFYGQGRHPSPPFVARRALNTYQSRLQPTGFVSSTDMG
jgi:Uncharacterized protein conserved in bacteria (DUF2252)